MLIDELKEILKRDLTKLKTEIESYSKESDLWIVSKDIKNSAGNLCLHLNGNLKHFIGTNLGKTGYLRDRESEFSIKNVSRFELIKSTNETIEIIENTLNSISNEDLNNLYPVEFLNKKSSLNFVLVHLTAHLSYHLGQINYHRRLLSE